MAVVDAGEAIRPPRTSSRPRTPSRLPKPAIAREDDGDFPALREDWFRAGRTSLSTTPAAALRHAAIAQRSRLQSRLRAPALTQVQQWQELGPRPQFSSQYGNVAGRVTAIATDTGRDPSGNTVYVGTAYGGVWKSSNGLSANPTFTPLTENAATLAVGAIALDASTNPTTVYVGTGEPDSSIDSYYGVGLMKSTDGGASWTTISVADNGFESFYGQSFSKILVDPNFPQVVLACTRLSGTPTFRNLISGIFRSVDYGLTWTMVFQATNGCSDLVYQSSTNTYFAALRGAGIYVSKQGGTSWVPAQTPFTSGTPGSLNNMRRIALATRNTELWALMVDANGNLSTPVPCPAPNAQCDSGLSVSNDGGHNWTAVPAPPSAFGVASQGWYDVYLAAPGNNGAVVLGGVDLWWGLWDGIANISWNNLTNGYAGGSVHPDQHAFAAVDDAHWYIGNDGGLWSTANMGVNWTNANSTIGAIQFTSVSADPLISGQYFGGSQDNGTASNPGNALTWNTIYGGDGGYTLASTQTPARYLTENYSVSLRRSDDRGATFSTVVDFNTIPDFSGFYVPYVFADSTENSLLLGTCRLWRGPTSAQNGTGWQPISGDLTNTSCNSYITAVAAASGAPDTVYAATRNGMVWQSTNATSQAPRWSNLTSSALPSRPFSAIAVDPNNPNNVFLTAQGFDTGHVFRRMNGNWVNVSGNLPNIPANAIILDPQHPLNVYVATDAGVYTTSDGGTPQSSWQSLGAGLPNVAVLEMKWTGGANPNLLVATHGRGAWLLPLSTSTALQTPVLQLPVNGSNAPAVATQFGWSPVPGATTYRLMASADPTLLPTNPTAIACPGCTLNALITGTSYTSPVTLANNTAYTWQIIAYNSSGQTSQWSLRSRFTAGSAPDALIFAPAVLNFGNVGIFSSVQQTLQVSNAGTTTALISSVALQDVQQFSLANGCPKALPPGSACQMSVAFSPQQIGAQQTQLTITNASTGTSNTLLATGTSSYASISIDTQSIAFGAQPLGSTSKTQTVTVSNPGFLPLVLGMFYAGDFSGTTTCGNQLFAGSSCTVSLAFHPVAKGLRTGSLTIFDNTAKGQHAIPLTGSGNAICGKQADGSVVACVDPNTSQ
ncbi:MAG: hypothetical protein NVS9B15_09260 [Acidobacteriaceae bacterium]